MGTKERKRTREEEGRGEGKKARRREAHQTVHVNRVLGNLTLQESEFPTVVISSLLSMGLNERKPKPNEVSKNGVDATKRSGLTKNLSIGLNSTNSFSNFLLYSINASS